MTDITISATSSVVSPTGSDSLVADLHEDIRRLLYTNSRDQRDKLAEGVNETAQVISLFYGNSSIQGGSLLSIDLEELYVWEVSGKNVSVDRGQYGTTTRSHPANTIIFINPKFSNYAIFRAINSTVLELAGKGLYRVEAVDLTWNSGVEGYNLDIDQSIEVYEVLWRGASENSNSWPVITDWRHARNLDTTVFASGQAIFLPSGGVVGAPIRVLYKAPFSAFTNLSDNVVGISGIPPHMHDIIVLGAAIRLAAPREIRRNFDESQGDTRRANEVPPGAVLNSYAGLAVQYRQRVLDERTRLASQYPDRKPRLWDVGPTTARRFG